MGEIGDGARTVEVFNEEHPDLVMMDIVMPIHDGIETTAEIKDARPDARRSK